MRLSLPLPVFTSPIVAALLRGWRALPWLLIAVLIVTALQPQAWDVERMLVAAKQQGPLAVEGARALQALLASLTDADDATRVQQINQFFNRRVRYAEDIDVWGQQDYWASPLEMLGKGAGDCEDYAIGKYFSLLAIGMPESKLRMVYVRAQIGGPGGAEVAHMVLAYYASPGAEPLILDSIISDVRPASRRPDLAPVFSFNGAGLWQGVGAQSAGDPLARMSRWRDVIAKARAEGFP